MAEEIAYLKCREERGEDCSIACCETMWRPEYSNWQIEGTPGSPYRAYIKDLLLVEANMQLRRRVLSRLLDANQVRLLLLLLLLVVLLLLLLVLLLLVAPVLLVMLVVLLLLLLLLVLLLLLLLTPRPNQFALSVSNYPLVGVPGFLKGMAEGELPSNPMGEKEAVSMSEFIPDSAINPHPRFGALTANIRRRRGGKVSITMPLLDDEATAATAAEAGAGMPNVEVHKDPLCELLK